MQSILTVTTAATDLSLLTEAELRQATGIQSGKTVELAALGRQIAAALTSKCNVKVAGATTPTLRLETLTQTFRLDCPADKLILARRPLIEIVSVVEDDVTLTDVTDYEISNAGAGFLQRLSNDYPAWWSASKIIVVFRAGWATVPDNLRAAAMKLAKVLWAEGGVADPNIKSISIPDVYTIERWVSQGDDPLFSKEIVELLGDYMNPAMA